ncbi:MAG: hypothetical protein AB1508_06940 [Pseudomonadota bacterium]
MTNTKPTVGAAIDEITKALETFDAHERNTILATVCALLKIAPPVGVSPQNLHIETPKGAELIKAAPQQSELEPGIDIKTLKNQKQPNSAREMACVVAYYLSEIEKQPTITATDIEKYFKQAGYKVPLAVEQVLPDAKKAGYFELESRGVYKLNRVGYNAVVHSMPRKEKG